MALQQNKQVYTQRVKTAAAVLTTAKTTYGDTTNAVLLVTAGADGSLVKKIKAMPRATVTATQLQLYLSKDAGATLFLLHSVLMAAYPMAQTTAVPQTDFGYSNTDPLRLEPNERLYVGIGVNLAGGIAFVAEYEDF